MAEQNGGGRADELFDLLSDFRDGDGSSAPKSGASGGASSTEAGPTSAENPADDGIRIFDGESGIVAPARLDGTPEDASDGGIDDALEILASRDSAADESSEGDLPVSIFGHLSEDGEEDIKKTASAEADGVEKSGLSLEGHFSSAEGLELEPLPAEDGEDGEEASEEASEETEKSERAGGIFAKISVVPKAIIYIVLVLLVSAYLSYYVISIGNDVFALVTDSHEVTVTIEEGATDETVAELLVENGVIEYGWVYKLYMGYRSDDGSPTEYIIGEHKLNTDYNYSQIITALTNKTANRQVVSITIPEGYTVDQIIALLTEKGVGQREDYIEAINNYPYKWDFVKRLTEMGYSADRKYRLEGYLYPDTYQFYTTEDEVYVINKMLSAFNDKFWKDFTKKNSKGESYEQMMKDDYGMSFDDVIVLASMVQSEGGTVEDFYAISYVFHNRLSHSSSYPRLESDATIQYVLPERLTDSAEINTAYDSPYNTYITKGLPPGAISNPGLDALSATLFPEQPTSSSGSKINAYFFVSNNAGKTYYASTKSGHDKNVAQVKKDNQLIAEGKYEQ